MKKPPPVDFRTESNLGTSNHADRDLSDTPESMTSHKAMGNNVNPVRAASPLPTRDNYRYGNNYERSRTDAYGQKQFKSGHHTSSGNEDFNKRENFNNAPYGNFRAKDTLNQRSESPSHPETTPLTFNLLVSPTQTLILHSFPTYLA